MKRRTGMSDPVPHDDATLGTLLLNAVAAATDPLRAKSRDVQHLKELQRRLGEGCLQLAVLGQFKRGKSTLLNALLGKAIVPAAVVPLTAVPTFVAAGSAPVIRSLFLSGETDAFAAADLDDLAAHVARLVTEDANPNNVLRLDSVEILLPAPLLEHGVRMIDTPGVGSTFRHNSERARAVLPECDVALFVVSPDPPLTEVELAYLAQVQATVAPLIVVMNKIDTLEPDDLTTALSFLRRTLKEQAGIADNVPLFPVSARIALRAKVAGDARGLASSGLPALEGYLGDFLTRQKRATLHQAIAKKAVTAVGNLLMQTELRLQALRLPIEDLDRRLALFDSSIVRFDQERRTVHDLLEGDRQRFLLSIEHEAETLRLHARQTLEGAMTSVLTSGNGVDEARAAVSALVPELFEGELSRAVQVFAQRLTAIVEAHRRRINALFDGVRQTAADVMNVTFCPGEEGEAFTFSRQPYWVTTEQIDMLAPLAWGFFERFLPPFLRRDRARRRVLKEIDLLAHRNVENLRWATIQNAQDTFRTVGGKCNPQPSRRKRHRFQPDSGERP